LLSPPPHPFAVDQNTVLLETRDVSKQSTKQTAPSGFNAAVGATIPSSVTLHAFPSDVIGQVPAVKSNDYAMMQSQLLVVDPTSKKIVDIIRQ
jgi:hypothetical protein